MSVLVEMAKLQATETQRATCQLGIGAIYFCMRSCEYLLVPQSEKKRTDIVRLRNIILKRNNKILRHDDPHLEYADSVTIVFEKQKKDEKSDKVTQHKTHHVLMNPPRIWAAIVKRIRSYPGSSDDTPVSAVWRNNRIEHITGQEMIAAIDRAALAIGYDNLGLKRGDFGTHSIRSGGAMAMALDDLPPYSIMMIGRWSTDTFMKYIRRQVDMFTHNIATRMNKHMSYRVIATVG